jgi:hypothetical protein
MASSEHGRDPGRRRPQGPQGLVPWSRARTHSSAPSNSPKSGEYSTVKITRGKLKAEGYPLDQVDGKALTKQRRALMKDTAPH